MQKLALLFLILLAGVAPAAFAKTPVTQMVTVEQLERALAAVHGVRDVKLARQISTMRLTERLSASTLAQLEKALPGEKARETLVALADESAYLDPPPAEIPSKPAPDPAAQATLLARTAEYLKKTVPSLPDLVAAERAIDFVGSTTVIASDLHTDAIDRIYWQDPLNLYAPTIRYIPYRRLSLTETSTTQVLYHNGQEFTQADKRGDAFALGNENLGISGRFGSVLTPVAEVLAANKVVWSHWEQGAHGVLAVFRYERTEPSIWYFYQFGGKWKGPTVVSHIQGKLALNPLDGSIVRLTEVARDSYPTTVDPPGKLPVTKDRLAERRNVVEYGPVQIGETVYLCPVRWVVSSLRQIWDPRGVGWNSPDSADNLAYRRWNLSKSPVEEELAGVAFSQYHLWTPVVHKYKRVAEIERR
jgi:hypothetical protein